MNRFTTTSAYSAVLADPRTHRCFPLLLLEALTVVLLAAGCGGPVSEPTLVLTQTPAGPVTAVAPQDLLDQRYPSGSRVVIARPPFQPGDVRIISQGLLAAGGPVVSPDGQRLLFVGKARADSDWQIYETNPDGDRPRAVTTMDGGAMDPAILSNGHLVFSSPVPKADATWQAAKAPALYAQPHQGPPQRLTFGSTAAIEPTVLRDGRILFVSARPSSSNAATPDLALFTVNNDGTEVTAFALDQDGAPLVRRPRELPDGRIAFLARNADTPSRDAWAETVRSARPFASRAKLLNFPVNRCGSVEPAEDGSLLITLETGGGTKDAISGSFAVYRVGVNAAMLERPLFDDPVRNDIEAARVVARQNPMGHISAMMPAKKTGTILCLDANFTRQRGTNDVQVAKAARVRVLAGGAQGQARVLGEVALYDDGSFLAEVPADIPIGFESLDTDGRVLHRLEPSIWIRPGENRSCIGCHEPYNRSPGNQRPSAAFSTPVPLLGNPLTLAEQAPHHEKK